MNHKVHLCINGCLTLKLSLSWKTVICSSPLGPEFLLPPSGEIGMVERSTWLVVGVDGATVVMFAVVVGRYEEGGRLIL